ncbi:protein ABHD15-like [Centruroides vittatus]|uniref:protein ABHD15-like n=1 Tax=Centruroides vittatus TaxID=120091 RepID=UPI00350EEEF7
MIFDSDQLLNYLIFTPISTCSAAVFILALFYHLLFGNCNKSRGHFPTLHYKESIFSRFLLDRIPDLRRPYYPPLWAYNPYVQASISYLLPCPEVRYRRQYLQLKDRGLVSLDWAVWSCQRAWRNSLNDHHLLLIIPNVTEDAVDVGEMSRRAMGKGFHPVVYNRRGHGRSPLTTPKFQSYGDPSDLRQAVKFIRSQHSGLRLSVVGYGTGADLLLSYLGEYGSSADLTAGVAISPIFDPESLYKRGLPLFYDFSRLLSFRRFLGPHAHVLSEAIDSNAALLSRTAPEFEKRVYWKMCNCSNWDEYWEKNAPLRDADEMSVPLLCVSSKDDPLVPRTAVPYHVFRVYPQMILVETANGGHCCFFQSGALFPRSWANSLTLDFIKVTLEFSSVEEQITKAALLQNVQ